MLGKQSAKHQDADNDSPTHSPTKTNARGVRKLSTTISVSLVAATPPLTSKRRTFLVLRDALLWLDLIAAACCSGRRQHRNSSRHGRVTSQSLIVSNRIHQCVSSQHRASTLWYACGRHGVMVQRDPVVWRKQQCV